MNLLFLDTETTGLDHNYHEVCSIAWRKYGKAEGVEYAVSCGYPERADTIALEVNGASREMLGNGTQPLYLRRHLEDFRGHTLAGWNIGFDIRFLMNRQQHILSADTYPFHYRPLDVASLAWPLLLEGKVDSLGLNAVCDYFGVSNDGAHNALRDVERTIAVYEHLVGVR